MAYEDKIPAAGKRWLIRKVKLSKERSGSGACTYVPNPPLHRRKYSGDLVIQSGAEFQPQ